jgi:hypothetical protein
MYLYYFISFMVIILLSSKEDDYSAVRACITKQRNFMVSPEHHWKTWILFGDI